MGKETPNNVRRRILKFLYGHYTEDPMRMSTPEDIMEDGTVSRESLAPNAFYLHDRGLIELMIGYRPPLFVAARISPDGIDLVENEEELDRRMPIETMGGENRQRQLIELVLQLAEEAEGSPLNGVRREWLFRDARNLRDEFRRPPETWRPRVVSEVIRGFSEYFGQDADKYLPALAKLRAMTSENNDSLPDVEPGG